MCVEYFPVPSSLSKVFVAPWEPGRKEIDTTREFDTVTGRSSGLIFFLYEKINTYRKSFGLS